MKLAKAQYKIEKLKYKTTLLMKYMDILALPPWCSLSSCLLSKQSHSRRKLDRWSRQINTGNLIIFIHQNDIGNMKEIPDIYCLQQLFIIFAIVSGIMILLVLRYLSCFISLFRLVK